MVQPTTVSRSLNELPRSIIKPSNQPIGQLTNMLSGRPTGVPSNKLSNQPAAPHPKFEPEQTQSY